VNFLVPWNFHDELIRFGPSSRDNTVSRDFARSYCAEITRSHSENFTVASVLLPRKLLPHFHAIYAYCRWADDLADETGGGAQALELLAWWRRELLAMYAGEPRHPIMIALQQTVKQFHIPPEPFLNLLIAFEHDQHVKRYATFDDVLGYCRNSANPVGVLVLHLFECATDNRMSFSNEICTGLQLANFWQDVARDSAIGRIYLPQEDLARFGITEHDIATKRFTPNFRAMMEWEVVRTRGFFARGMPLLPLLPPQLRIDIDLFIRGGVATLDAIQKVKFDVLTARPRISKWKKAQLLLHAVFGLLTTARGPG